MANTKAILFSELVDREAREIAKEILRQKLEKENLPLPKDSALELHIDNLLAIDPRIRELAETRVNAQTDAYSESLKAIGLELEIVRPIDI